MFLRAFLLVTASTPLFFRTTRCHTVSFHDQLSHHISMLVCVRFVGLPSQHSLDWLQSYSFFQLLTLALWSPFLPTDRPGLFQQHVLHVLCFSAESAPIASHPLCTRGVLMSLLLPLCPHGVHMFSVVFLRVAVVQSSYSSHVSSPEVSEGVKITVCGPSFVFFPPATSSR